MTTTVPEVSFYLGPDESKREKNKSVIREKVEIHFFQHTHAHVIED